MMQLEDYFDFLAPDDIRIKGHRVGIENILYEYIHNALTPEEISERFDTIRLEDIYATILYYLHNKEQVDAYLTEWIEHGERMWAEQQWKPSPAMVRYRQMQIERREAERRQIDPTSA
jgi:uncharacterized protein (DUF433 family)